MNDQDKRIKKLEREIIIGIWLIPVLGIIALLIGMNL